MQIERCVLSKLYYTMLNNRLDAYMSVLEAFHDIDNPYQMSTWEVPSLFLERTLGKYYALSPLYRIEMVLRALKEYVFLENE